MLFSARVDEARLFFTAKCLIAAKAHMEPKNAIIIGIGITISNKISSFFFVGNLPAKTFY